MKKVYRLFRLATSFLVLGALLLAPVSVSSQPLASPAASAPPVNPAWNITRLASHYLLQGFPPDMHTSHSFGVDSAGHPHIVYGADRLYYAHDDGTGWKSETVDDYGGGVSNASFALDGSGNPIASYCRRGSPYNPLMYTLHIGGSWQVSVVDSSDRACGSTSIAVDASGGVHIAYFSLGSGTDTGEIRYAYWLGLGWVHTTLVSGLDSMSGGVNLAIGSDNTVHITYYDANTLGLYYLRRTSTEWEAPRLVASGFSTINNSLAIGPDHLPYISYVSGGNLDYSYFDGAFYQKIVRQGVSGQYFDVNSISFGYNEFPVVAYHFTYNQADYISYSWREDSYIYIDAFTVTGTTPYVNLAINPADYAIRLAFLGGATLYYSNQAAGGYAVIDGSSQYHSSSTSLVLDGVGRARISYYDTYAGHLMRAFEATGQPWWLNPMDTDGAVGKYSSEAISSDAAESIAYYDATNGDLKLTFDNGTGYETQTVDNGSGADVGRYPSLKMDSLDKWHVSYYDVTNANLKYAWYDNGWNVQTVDSAGDVGMFSSMVLDENNHPHIAYYDATNGALKYAYNTGAGWVTATIDQPASGQAGYGIALAPAPGGLAVAYIVLAGTDSVQYKRCSFQRGICHLDLASPETVSTQVFSMDWNGEAAGVGLAVSAAGAPFISFDHFDGLAVASKKSSGWAIEKVDTLSLSCGSHSSLAIDKYGRVHVSYIDDSFGGLKYAVQYSRVFLPMIKK